MVACDAYGSVTVIRVERFSPAQVVVNLLVQTVDPIILTAESRDESRAVLPGQGFRVPLATGLYPLVGVVVHIEKLERGETRVKLAERTIFHCRDENLLDEVFELSSLPQETRAVGSTQTLVVMFVDPNVVESGKDVLQ
ncbi:hypothetical protein GCM10020255_013920 [Rhodococcus baikonurensis]